MARYSPEDSKERNEAKKAVSAYLQEFLAKEKKPVIWLVEQTGLSRGNLSRIINGHTLPDAATCRAISTALGQPEEHLLKLAGYIRPASPADLAQDDPELALYFHQINRLGPDSISFFKQFLKQELERIHSQSDTAPRSRPPFAQPLDHPTTTAGPGKERP